MATSLLSLLRLVPWGEVIRNAPKVAEGAKRLWENVSGKAAPLPLPAEDAVQNKLQAEAHAIARLQSELKATETALAELQAQMLAATQLINDLADQNAQLVRQAETQRIRLTWLSVATAVLAVVAVALVMKLAG